MSDATQDRTRSDAIDATYAATDDVANIAAACDKATMAAADATDPGIASALVTQ